MMRGRAILVGTLFLYIPSSVRAQAKPRVVHVFVALADNQHQGIVPVPPALGNGDDPARNLYWGAAFGVRTFFKKASEWNEVLSFKHPTDAIWERSVFQNRANGTLLVADAYRGSEIKQAMTDFFRAAAGIPEKVAENGATVGGSVIRVPPVADLVAYVGHDGLMDFSLTVDFAGHADSSRPAIVLACASRSFFKGLLKQSGATPLLWTNGLMAPEAYTLKAALDGWMADESSERIRRRAAGAYAKYQKCSEWAAMQLFSSSW